MRAGWNVALQAVVLIAFAALRLYAAGWLLLILIVTGLGLLTLVPLVLAVVAVRRRVLAPALVAPFVACDVTMLVGALLMPDGGDSGESWAPLWNLLGNAGSEVPTAFAAIGFAAVLGYLASTLWLIVAFCATATGRRTGPPPLPPGVTVPPPGFGPAPAGFGAPPAGFAVPPTGFAAPPAGLAVPSAGFAVPPAPAGPGGPPPGQAPWASYPAGPASYPGSPSPYPSAPPWPGSHGPRPY